MGHGLLMLCFVAVLAVFGGAVVMAVKNFNQKLQRRQKRQKQ